MADINSQQVISHNQKAWNRQVEIGCRWTVPVGKKEIDMAQSGAPEIFLTSGTSLPLTWIENMKGKRVLLLAGGGGQQSALLASFGCDVVVADLSDKQLDKDKEVAEQFGLKIEAVCADAADLSFAENAEFDFILNPVSNCFFPNLKDVWHECYRVLKKSGELQFGFVNPHSYMFDFELANKEVYQVKYALPYSDITSLNEEEKKRFLSNESPLEFGHSLDQQIGDLCEIGFMISGFFSDRDAGLYANAKYMANYFNVRAIKS